MIDVDTQADHEGDEYLDDLELPDDYATHYGISSYLKGNMLVFRADANHAADLITKNLTPVDVKQSGIDVGEPYWDWDDINDEFTFNGELNGFMSRVPHYVNGEEVDPFNDNYCFLEEIASMLLEDVFDATEDEAILIASYAVTKYLKVVDPKKADWHFKDEDDRSVQYWKRKDVAALLKKIARSTKLADELLTALDLEMEG